MYKYFSIIFSPIWGYCVLVGSKRKLLGPTKSFPFSTVNQTTTNLFFFFSPLFSPLFFIPSIITPTKWGLKSTQARIKVFFIYLFIYLKNKHTHTHTHKRERERERERCLKCSLDSEERRENLVIQQNVLVVKGFNIIFYFILLYLTYNKLTPQLL